MQVQRSDIVAEHIGGTASKTWNIMKKVGGGGEGGVVGCLVCRRSINLMLFLRARFWEGDCGDAYGQQ